VTRLPSSKRDGRPGVEFTPDGHDEGDPQEPAGALLLFDLAEDWLDGLSAFGVADLAVLAGRRGPSPAGTSASTR